MPIDAGGEASWTASDCGDASGEGVVIFSSVVDDIISGARGVTVGRGSDSASADRDSGEPVSIGFIDCSMTGVIGAAAGFGGAACCQALLGGICSRFAETGITELPLVTLGVAVGVVTRVVVVGVLAGIGVVGFMGVGVLAGIGVEAITAGCDTLAGCVGAVGVCTDVIGCTDDVGCIGNVDAGCITDVLVDGVEGPFAAFMSRDGFTRG